MSARAHMLLALQAVYILPLPSGSVWAVAVCLMAWDVARGSWIVMAIPPAGLRAGTWRKSREGQLRPGTFPGLDCRNQS